MRQSVNVSVHICDKKKKRARRIRNSGRGGEGDSLTNSYAQPYSPVYIQSGYPTSPVLESNPLLRAIQELNNNIQSSYVEKTPVHQLLARARPELARPSPHVAQPSAAKSLDSDDELEAALKESEDAFYQDLRTLDVIGKAQEQVGQARASTPASQPIPKPIRFKLPGTKEGLIRMAVDDYNLIGTRSRKIN